MKGNKILHAKERGNGKFFNLMTNIMGGNICGVTLDNYNDRKIGRINPEDNKGIGVSTIFASDVEKFETALLDSNGAHPVERYKKKEDAILGHEKWILFAKTGHNKTVTELDSEDTADDEEIVLEKVS